MPTFGVHKRHQSFNETDVREDSMEKQKEKAPSDMVEPLDQSIPET